MKTCIHDDCVVVWEEYRSNGDDRTCPMCELEKEDLRLKVENDKMQMRIDDLEEREQ